MDKYNTIDRPMWLAPTYVTQPRLEV